MTKSDPHTSRVLIAEDVKVISFAISKTLEAKGFEVAVAQDGEQCLEMARSFRPELIVLDIMMPKMHGLEVLKQLKSDADTRSIGVIICTAKGFKPEIERAKELGAIAVILKPFARKDLVEQVEQFFSHKAAVEVVVPVKLREPIAGGQTFLPRLDDSSACYRFWGTRGSIPISGPQYIRHGGNTSCLEIEHGTDRIIFDAGSGIRDLGLSLMSGKTRKIHLFITHTHWDHIQGFPFFAPAYDPDFDITIYGAEGFGKDLKAVFQGQLDRDYFPVQMNDMRANLEFKHLGDASIRIGEAIVSYVYTQHPGATVGYKIAIGDKTIAYVPDNEFLKGYVGQPHELRRHSELVTLYEPIIEFLSGVHLLFHEAQYTNEEYVHKIGWGHSALSNACVLAKLANVRKWIVIHHDPMYSDDFLQGKLNLTRQLLHNLDYPIEVSHAYDGLVGYLTA